jgi:hypothetical protein
MPEWLAVAVGMVWADMENDGLLPEVEPCAGTGDAELPGMYFVGLAHRSAPQRHSISGAGVSEDDLPAVILVSIADNFQNVVSEMPGAWGQACPYHLHPMKPVVLDEKAWWICAIRDERLGRIGAQELTPIQSDHAS